MQKTPEKINEYKQKKLSLKKMYSMCSIPRNIRLSAFSELRAGLELLATFATVLVSVYSCALLNRA